MKRLAKKLRNRPCSTICLHTSQHATGESGQPGGLWVMKIIAIRTFRSALEQV